MKVGITNGCKWSPPTTHELPADILYPLATETCWELGHSFCGYHRTSAVVLDDKLYLGVARMVLYSADVAAWKVLSLPMFRTSTYHSQLHGVGWRDPEWDHFKQVVGV